MSHTLGKDPSSETTCCKCLNHPETDGQHRMKRLKTIRERRRMRSGGKNAAKTKSHHHRCCRQASKDTAHSCNCCHGGCNPRREPLFAKVVPAAQEPSIITDHRLIGHHGLFNHEVKSVDIERLLSKQRKLDNAQEKTHKENPNLSHPSSASPASPASCGNALVDDEAAENLPFEDKKEPWSDTSADCQEIQEKISRGSDLTPAQRPHQQRHRSPDSYRSIFSSKHSFLDVVISTDKKKVDSVTREKDKESPLSLTLDDVETPVTPENKAPAAPQTHTCGVSPSSPPLSSFATQHGGEDPARVSFITATAARLCDSLQLPRLWRRDLLAESRERLLMVLRARRGPWLQENLLTEQRHVTFGPDQDHSLDGDEVLSAACHVDTVDQSAFDSQKSTKSNLKPHQSMKWTADWWTSPTSFLDDILRPRSSPQFCMDFEPSGASAREHLSPPCLTSCRTEKASVSQHWDKSLFRPKCRELPGFDSFENRFLNHSRTVGERRCVPWFKDTRPSLSYQTQPVHFSLESDPFTTDRRSFPPPFSTHMPNPDPSSHLQTHRRSSHTAAEPLLSSHHSDMIHYPPSHMLDRSPAPSPFSLSPEHWSFPPMKLY